MPIKLLETGKNIITTEANALLDLSARLDNNFVKSCDLIRACSGKVILIGMGKSGHISNKIAATFASTGTPAFAVHPGEAGHGDLGMISKNDVVICISYSGEVDEIITLIPSIQRLGTPIISMTGNANSTIAKNSDIHIDVRVEKEACPHNLTPTSSTTAALATGDALAISLLIDKGFSPDDFARSHPSGALGRRLLTSVGDIMQTGDDIPLVDADSSLLDALKVMSQKSLGMVLIVDEAGLLGIFTDGDLRRVLEIDGNVQKLKIKQLMNSNCKTINADKPAIMAVKMMDEFSLNSLPVVDQNNQVVGAINTHTLMQARII